MDLLSTLGLSLAVSGAILSIIGNILNTLCKNHYHALVFWSVSSPIVMIWAFGLWLGWWDGGLSAVAVFGMYLIFTVSNWYYLLKRLLATPPACEGCHYHDGAKYCAYFGRTLTTKDSLRFLTEGCMYRKRLH